jgi:hypothetical protein
VCNCLTDEGRPLGTGLQERVPNNFRRLWSKAMVVSTGGKGLGRTRSGGWQEEDRKGTTDDVSSAARWTASGRVVASLDRKCLGGEMSGGGTMLGRGERPRYF